MLNAEIVVDSALRIGNTYLLFSSRTDPIPLKPTLLSFGAVKTGASISDNGLKIFRELIKLVICGE